MLLQKCYATMAVVDGVKLAEYIAWPLIILRLEIYPSYE